MWRGRGRLPVVGLALGLLTACSESPLTGTATGVDAATRDAAGEVFVAAIRTKDGVPIGDCTEPTAEELAAMGCPVTRPIAGTACDVPDGVFCRYAIETANGI